MGFKCGIFVFPSRHLQRHLDNFLFVLIFFEKKYLKKIIIIKFLCKEFLNILFHFSGRKLRSMFFGFFERKR